MTSGPSISTSPSVGSAPDGPHSTVAYVGEADAVRTRLDQHQREKDFWTDAYVLTTTDNSLNKAQVRYLEASLLGLAREADLATLDNGTAPATPYLSEPDIAVMDSYGDYALSLLPLLGVTIFESIDNVPDVRDDVQGQLSEPESAPGSEEIVSGSVPRPHLRTVLTEAEGIDDARGYVVFEGATARRQESVMLPGYRELRMRLIAEGILAPFGDDQYRLTKTYAFDSPSAAASVLSGGSKNGRIEWRTRTGSTLRGLQERSVTVEPPVAVAEPGEAIQ